MTNFYILSRRFNFCIQPEYKIAIFVCLCSPRDHGALVVVQVIPTVFHARPQRVNGPLCRQRAL